MGINNIMGITNEFFKPGKLTIIMDAQFGSSGKGKIGSYVGANADNWTFCCNTFSAQAGHWVKLEDGRKFFYQHLNSVAYQKGRFEKIYIGPGSVIEVSSLLREIKENKVEVRELGISPQAMILNDELDKGFETGVSGFNGSHIESRHTGTAKFGSTAHGIGSATARKVLRLPSVQLAKNHPDLAPYICDVTREILSRLKKGESGLLEIAQGFPLSMNSRFYPFCLCKDSRILLADGRTKPISKIMVGDVVETRDINGYKSSGSVVNTWSRTLGNRQFYNVITETTHTHLNGKVVGGRFTGDHLLPTPQGERRVEDLRPGDEVYTGEYSMSGDGLQIFLGSLLGDGSVCAMTNCRNRSVLSFTHGPRQTGYCRAKADVVQRYIGGEVRNVACSRTSFKPGSLHTRYESSYSTDIHKLAWRLGCWGKKRPNMQAIIGLTDHRAIAIWYQDDGQLKTTRMVKSGKTYTYKQVVFHTNGFTDGEVRILAQALKDRFGLRFNPTRVKVNRGFCTQLYLSRKDTNKFFDLIRDYIHPNLSYKVLGLTSWRFGEDVKPFFVTEQVLEIKPWKAGRRKGYGKCYDIEVERDHNFFVGNGTGFILAHNCTSRNVTVAQGLSDMFLPVSVAGPVILNLRTFPIRISSKKYIAEGGRHLTWQEVQNGVPHEVFEGNSGYWYPDQEETTWEEITKNSGSPTPIMEITSVTKLPRRVADFSRENLVEAIEINGTFPGQTFLSLNFANYVDYEITGKRETKDITRKLSDWTYNNMCPEDMMIRFIGTGPLTEDTIFIK